MFRERWTCKRFATRVARRAWGPAAVKPTFACHVVDRFRAADVPGLRSSGVDTSCRCTRSARHGRSPARRLRHRAVRRDAMLRVRLVIVFSCRSYKQVWHVVGWSPWHGCSRLQARSSDAWKAVRATCRSRSRCRTQVAALAQAWTQARAAAHPSAHPSMAAQRARWAAPLAWPRVREATLRTQVVSVRQAQGEPAAWALPARVAQVPRAAQATPVTTERSRARVMRRTAAMSRRAAITRCVRRPRRSSLRTTRRSKSGTDATASCPRPRLAGIPRPVAHTAVPPARSRPASAIPVFTGCARTRCEQREARREAGTPASQPPVSARRCCSPATRSWTSFSTTRRAPAPRVSKHSCRASLSYGSGDSFAYRSTSHVGSGEAALNNSSYGASLTAARL